MLSSIRDRLSSSAKSAKHIDEELLAEFPDEPIPLVQINDDESFSVNEDALDILRKIEAKVSIVAVAGLYRTGKSSLLNWLMDRQAGFTVGPTVQRCTRGIWIWGRPRIGRLPNGEECWIVLLDTEGIGGLEADSQYDARIFSLATLLCSTLVYNSLGSIDEAAISNLSFIANLTQHIRISSGSAPVSAEEEALQFHQFFPAFCWVIRDFALDLVDEDGERITPAEYLENSLKTQSGFDKATTERNRIRHMLTSFFQDRNCTTLVRPINDERALQKVDEVPYSKLRREFRQSMDALKKQLFEQLKPKALSGRELNGAMFAGLTAAYVQAINEGGVPTISSAWEGVSKQECRDASEAALNKFRQSLHQEFGGSSLSALPAEHKDLMSRYKSAYEHGMLLYGQRSVGDEAPKYKEQLQEKMEEELERLSNSNEAASKQACDALLQTLFSEVLHTKVHGSDSESDLNVESLIQDFDVLERKYFGSAVGPAKSQSLSAFIKAKWPEAATALQQRQAVRHEAELRQKEEEVASARAELATVNTQLQATKKKLQDAERDFSASKADKINLETQLAAQTKRLEEATAQLRLSEIEVEELTEANEGKAGIIQRQEEEAKRARAEFDAKVENLNQQIDELGEAGLRKDQALKDTEAAFIKKLEEQITAHNEAMKEAKEQAEQKLQEARSEVAFLNSSLQKKEEELLGRIEETQHGASENLKELSSQFEGKLAAVNDASLTKEKEYREALESVHSELDNKDDALAKAQARVQGLTAELEQFKEQVNDLGQEQRQQEEEFENMKQQYQQRLEENSEEISLREKALQAEIVKMDEELENQKQVFENIKQEYERGFEKTAEETSVREKSLQAEIEDLQQRMDQVIEEGQHTLNTVKEEAELKMKELNAILTEKDKELEDLQVEHEKKLLEVTATAKRETARLHENMLLGAEEFQQMKTKLHQMTQNTHKLSEQYSSSLASNLAEVSRLLECNGLAQEEIASLGLQIKEEQKRMILKEATAQDFQLSLSNENSNLKNALEELQQAYANKETELSEMYTQATSTAEEREKSMLEEITCQKNEIKDLSTLVTRLEEELEDEREASQLCREELSQVTLALSVLKTFMTEKDNQYQECIKMSQEEVSQWGFYAKTEEKQCIFQQNRVTLLEKELETLQKDFADKEKELVMLCGQATSTAEEREQGLLKEVQALKRLLEERHLQAEELALISKEEIAHWRTAFRMEHVHSSEKEQELDILRQRESALTESLLLSAEELYQLKIKLLLLTQQNDKQRELSLMAVEDYSNLKAQLLAKISSSYQQAALMSTQLERKSMAIEDLSSSLNTFKGKYSNQLSDSSDSAQNMKIELDSHKEAAAAEAWRLQAQISDLQDLVETREKELEDNRHLAEEKIEDCERRIQSLQEQGREKEQQLEAANKMAVEEILQLKAEALLSKTLSEAKIQELQEMSAQQAEPQHTEIKSVKEDPILSREMQQDLVSGDTLAFEEILHLKSELLVVQALADAKEHEYISMMKVAKSSMEQKEKEFRTKQEELVAGIKCTEIELDSLKSDFDEQFFHTFSQAAEKESEQGESLQMANEEITQLRTNASLLRKENETQNRMMKKMAQDLDEREVHMVERMQEAATMLEDLTTKYEEQMGKLKMGATNKESELLEAIKAAALELDDCQTSFEQREVELKKELEEKQDQLQELTSRWAKAMEQRKRFFEENQHQLMSSSMLDNAKLNEEIENTTRLLEILEKEADVKESTKPTKREKKLQQAYDAAQHELVGLRDELDRWRSSMTQATLEKERQLASAKEAAARELAELKQRFEAREQELMCEADARKMGLLEAQQNLEEMQGQFESHCQHLTEVSRQREKQLEEAHSVAAKNLEELESQYQDKLKLSLDNEVSSQDIENIKAEHEKQQSELAATAATREAELQQEVEECQDQLRQLSSEYEHNVSGLTEKLQRQEKELAALNDSSTEELNQLRLELEQQISESQKAATAREAGLIEALADLKEQFDRQKDDMEAALNTERELEAAKDALEEELRELQDRVQCTDAAEEDDLFQQELSNAFKEIEMDLLEEISAAEEQLVQCQKDVENIQELPDLTAWQRAQQELELHEKVERAEEYVRYLKANLEAKRLEMNGPTHKTPKDLLVAKENAQRKLEELKGEHKKREEELQECMREMKEKYDKEIRMVQDHMHGVKKLSQQDHHRLSRFWDCLEDPAPVLREQVDSLRSQLNVLQTQAPDADMAAGEGIVGHLQRVRRERKKYKDEVRRLREEIQKLAKDFEDKLFIADEMLTDAKQKLSEKMSDNVNLQAQNEELQGELQKQQKRFIELAADVKIMQIQSPKALQLGTDIGRELYESDDSETKEEPGSKKKKLKDTDMLIQELTSPVEQENDPFFSVQFTPKHEGTPTCAQC